MTIRPLSPLSLQSFSNWGNYGYSTREIYELSRTETADQFGFKLTSIAHPWQKTWEISPEDIESWNTLIREGHSWGAYDGNKLAGFAIAEARDWNNSLYLENFQIAESYRGSGIGTGLMKTALEHARKHRFRMVELETQNTNLPAIRFYRKQGFHIAGIHTLLYDGLPEKEIAVYMAYVL